MRDRSSITETGKSMSYAVVTMQKDENDLVGPWWRYYAGLFGAENVHIIDNGSTDQSTISELNLARSAGVTVIIMPGSEAFEGKGRIISDYIHSILSAHKLVIPCDCDEFIVESIRSIPTSDKAAVLRALDRAEAENKPVVRLHDSLWNIPNSTSSYYAPIRKSILRPGSGIILDLGFHLYSWDTNQDTIPTSSFAPTTLGFIHFHNKPYAKLLAAAREKLKARVPDFSIETLQKYQGAGRHLCKYFQMTESEYMSSFPQGTTDIGFLFSTRGLALPFLESTEAASVDQTTIEDLAQMSQIQNKFAGSMNEFNTISERLAQSQHYMEYGSGATTALACKLGVQLITSIETDISFCQRLIRDFDLLPYIHTNRLRLMHIDLGKTKEWGYPVNKPNKRKLENYFAPLLHSCTADTILLDGRYRVACAAAAYLGSPAGCQILIHDYSNRPGYSIVERFLREEHRVENLSIFSKIDGKQAEAEMLFQRYFEEPH